MTDRVNTAPLLGWQHVAIKADDNCQAEACQEQQHGRRLKSGFKDKLLSMLAGIGGEDFPAVHAELVTYGCLSFGEQPCVGTVWVGASAKRPDRPLVFGGSS